MPEIALSAAVQQGLPEIAYEVPSRLWNVRGDLGDEIQGIEDLEVAGDAAEEIGAGGVGHVVPGA